MGADSNRWLPGISTMRVTKLMYFQRGITFQNGRTDKKLEKSLLLKYSQKYGIIGTLLEIGGVSFGIW